MFVSSLAWAQPDIPTGASPDADQPAPPVEPPEAPPPVPPDEHAVAPPVPVDADREPPAPVPPETIRPNRYSVGIGFGYRLPTELNLPNITSARFRLASGLTFEPMLTLVNTTVTDDDGAAETNDVNAILAAGAFVRYPFRSHGRVDFDLLAGVAIANQTINPDGDHNSRHITIFGLDYGMALDYWLNQHWNLSMTVTNPLVAIVSETTEHGPGNPDTSTTDRQLGLIFAARVAIMLHLQL